MINDIEAARSRLDRLYQMMDVDEIAERMREFGSPTTPERNDQVNFLYTIRIVRAENLLALDNNGFSDPYVVLEINKEEIARTRTVYKSLTPRWDQTFDICLNEREADVLAIVYDEDVIGSNGECGSVWFKLSPKYYDDYQTHDFTLPLHPQGKLQLRISMVGEKDDIQFWFVRAFRTLKRAENDAASLIVDQVCIEHIHVWVGYSYHIVFCVDGPIYALLSIAQDAWQVVTTRKEFLLIIQQQNE